MGLSQSILQGVTHCFSDHPVDPTGYHFIARNCGSPATYSERLGAYRNIRHDTIVASYTSMISWCGLQPVREPDMLPGLDPYRRGDILIRDYPSRGVHTVLDVCCGSVFTGAGTLMPGLLSGDTAGAIALKHERRKTEAYQDLRPSHAFIPLIHEQFGRVELRANSFLVQLAVHKSGQLLGTTSDQVKSHPLFARTFNPILTKWRRDLSLALALENANCVIKGRRNTLGRYRGGTMPDAAHGVENEWFHHYVGEYGQSRGDQTGIAHA
jgi:hypothetical protein